MRADKLLPRGRGLPLWSRWKAMAFQDVAHRLVADSVPEVREGSDNPIIAPGTILARHAYHQRFHFLVDHGTAGRLPLRGTIELLRYEFAVPGQDGVGFDDGGHLFEGFLPQLLADLSQSLALAIAEAHAALNLAAQDTIFRHQVLVP